MEQRRILALVAPVGERALRPGNAEVRVDSDAELEAYYKANASQFQAPEQASIEYLVLDLEAAKKNVSVNEADLKTYYEQNKARFGTKEERRASHILITAPASAPASGRSKDAIIFSRSVFSPADEGRPKMCRPVGINRCSISTSCS